MKSQLPFSSIRDFVKVSSTPTEDAVVLRKSYPSVIETNQDKVFVATLVDESVDRDGDVVVVSGCKHEGFDVNPVLLWGHAHNQPPCGRIEALAMGTTTIAVTARMADTEQANELWSLVHGGFLRTLSVGFLPIKTLKSGTAGFTQFWQARGEQVPAGCKQVIVEWELVEASLCSVPAQPAALIHAVSTKAVTLSEKLVKQLGIEVPAVEVVTPEVLPVKPEAVWTVTRVGPYVLQSTDQPAVKALRSGKIRV